MSSIDLTRRQVLSNLAAIAGASVLARDAEAMIHHAMGECHPAQAALSKEHDRIKYYPFPLSQVRLRPGPFYDMLERNRQYLHSLPTDRLLHVFRLNAGLPSTAVPLGGWEAPGWGFRGHFSGGHYLSACAMTYAATGDTALKAKADAMVSALAECQRALNAGGYLTALPIEFYTVTLRQGYGWSPLYMVHKILAGLLDMYTYCGNKEALSTAERLADWLVSYARPVPDDQWAIILDIEHGGITEVCYDLYEITGKPDYLELANRFYHKAVLDPLANKTDALEGLHANTNIPKIVGAARGYEVMGDVRQRTIAEYFWNQVTSHRCFCTGGTTSGEIWQVPLSAHLEANAQECCCGYNMLKVTRHLFGWTGDARTMDYYERTLFNSRLGTQDQHGMFMYFLPLHPGAWKTFGEPTTSFWCCYGSGIEEYAKTGNSIYFHDDTDLYVNLFIASEVNWPDKKVRLVQETNFPQEPATHLTVWCAKPVHMPIHIRVPYWIGPDASVTVNGKPVEAKFTPSTYLTLDRQWSDGDTIVMRLPMRLHAEPFEDDKTVQAMMYGPLVLAGRLGPVSDTTISLDPAIQVPVSPNDIPLPEIKASAANPNGWVEQVSTMPLDFQTVGQPKTIALSPLYHLSNERYTVYWKVK